MKLRCHLACAGINWPQEDFFSFLFIVLPSSVFRAVRQVRTLLNQKCLSSCSRAVPRCSKSQAEGVVAFFFMFCQLFFPESCSLSLEMSPAGATSLQRRVKDMQLHRRTWTDVQYLTSHSDFSLSLRLLISHFGSCSYSPKPPFVLSSMVDHWASTLEI